MGLFNKLVGKEEYTPNHNADWKVYYEDMSNGMSYEDRQAKLASGGYAKGKAKPSKEHGRIDDVWFYNWYVEHLGETSAEIARRKGLFANK